MAHGSRRKASNEEIRALTERLRVAEIERVQKECPSVDIHLAPYLGAAEGLVGLLMAQASRVSNHSPAQDVSRPA